METGKIVGRDAILYNLILLKSLSFTQMLAKYILGEY